MTTFHVDIVQDCYHREVYDEDGFAFNRTVFFYCIVAQSDRGERWALDRSSTEDESQARRWLEILSHNPLTNPDAWVQIDPVYGSDAWDSQAEYDLACFEADAYGEPRPNW